MSLSSSTDGDEELRLTTMFVALEPREHSHLPNTNHSLYPMMTASTPVTPIPSTPTTTRTHPLLEQKLATGDKPPRIIRPKSTPFPEQDLLQGEIHCLRRPNESEAPLTESPIHTAASHSLFQALPSEIHDCILDHIFGFRTSASRFSGTAKSQTLRGWGSVFRHSRRREVTELALVSDGWRRLIQERLYRHVKIKGTRNSIDQAMVWFSMHPHLCAYVKHVEIWFPVFQPKPSITDKMRRLPVTPPERMPAGMMMQMMTLGGVPANGLYQIATNNCSLDEAFGFVKYTFPQACVLTLEGGERKKPPRVDYFSPRCNPANGLPKIDSIRTLVIKGQWNIVRARSDFETMVKALPNLSEWQGSYAKPKSKAYLSMATILPHLPANLTHLNICLEGDFKREAVSPLLSRKVAEQTNFCVEMARSMPALEHLVYSGRVCGAFFATAARLSDPRTSKLKSIELIVKNVCRPPFMWNDGTGIMDINFIHAFESLVVAGVKSLKRLSALEYLRIRFIDLGEFDEH